MNSCEFFYSGGKQMVTVGDKFTWKGMHPGEYEVIELPHSAGVYSPAGFGGTGTVMVKNLGTGKIDEWCGNSVAAGIANGRIK